MRVTIIIAAWAVVMLVFSVSRLHVAIESKRLDTRVVEAERRTADLEAVIEGRECAANPRECSSPEVTPGRESFMQAVLDIDAHPLTGYYGPTCFELRDRWERRERAARRSLPVLTASEARWRHRPDRAWECIANIGGVITSTGAAVCVERRARFACPHEGGPRYLSDEDLEVMIDEGRVW